jgi:hypothetical protein
MFPSPSLGPPLLSESASPPLFCGIPDAAALELELWVLVALLDAAGLDELEEPPPPQPATATATTATAAIAAKRKRSRLIRSFMCAS